MNLTEELKNQVASDPVLNRKIFPQGNPKITVKNVSHTLCVIDECKMWDTFKENHVVMGMMYGGCDMCSLKEECDICDSEELSPCMKLHSDPYTEDYVTIFRPTDSINL